MATTIDSSVLKSDNDSTNDIYNQKLTEFHDLCYDTNSLSNKIGSKFIPSHLLKPKIIGIIFSIFYFQSLVLTYYLLDEKFIKCSETRKVKIGKLLVSSFYVTISTL